MLYYKQNLEEIAFQVLKKKKKLPFYNLVFKTLKPSLEVRILFSYKCDFNFKKLKTGYRQKIYSHILQFF